MRTGFMLEPTRVHRLASCALLALVSAAALSGSAPPALARPDRTAADARSEKAARRASGPLTLVVSLHRQRISVYDRTTRIAEAPISSGRPGFPTPTGVFTILQKNRIHYSNLYESAPMPFMQRLTWSGVALHAGHLPGYPASHGCIRLPHGFARELFQLTRLGARVIVAREDVAPVAITHPALPAPLPSAATLAVAGENTPAFPPGEGVSAATGATQAGMVLTMGTAVRTRESVAAERAAKRQDLADAAAAAEAKRAEAAARAREATLAAQEARNAVKTARAEAELLARAVEKARREVATAQAELAELMRRNAAAAADPERAGTVAEKEEAIEARILDAMAELEAVEAEAEEHRAEIEPLAERAAAADRDRIALMAKLAEAGDEVAAAQAAQAAAERLEAQRKQPITVLVSRKTQRLYVRQGYEPLLEVPVALARPEAPIGTHVFTALELEPGERALRWSVVSLGHDAAEASMPHRPRDGRATLRERPTPAAAALDRLTIPEQALELISELIKPGSSLIVSDYGVGNETGQFTDIIVQTR